MPYLLAHDLGTSGNKATLYTTEGRLMAGRAHPYDLLVTHGNWAEQRADDWWAGGAPHHSGAYRSGRSRRHRGGFFQRSDDGLFVPRRGWSATAETPSSGPTCALRLRSVWCASRWRKADIFTTSPVTASAPLTPLLSCARSETTSRNSIKKPPWCSMPRTISSHRLTGRFVTDRSDASATCLYDLNKRQWSDDMLALFGVDREKLPELLPSTAVAGRITAQAAEDTGLLAGTPVVCGGGDGPCAAVGTGCVRERIANSCMGTSSWISMASRTPVTDRAMTTVNFDRVVYPVMCYPAAPSKAEAAP